MNKFVYFYMNIVAIESSTNICSVSSFKDSHLINIIEKKRTKLEVFKLTANMVPNTTPIATNTPKVLTILKSTALNFM